MTIPEFVSATVLILIFSVWLGWLPGIVRDVRQRPGLGVLSGNSVAGLRFGDGDDGAYPAHGPLVGD